MSLKKETIVLATVLATSSMFATQMTTNNHVLAAENSDEAYYPKPGKAQDMPTDPSQDQEPVKQENTQSQSATKQASSSQSQSTQNTAYTILETKKSSTASSQPTDQNKAQQALTKSAPKTREANLSVKPKAQTPRKETTTKKNTSKKSPKSKSKTKKVVNQKNHSNQSKKHNLFELKDAVIGSIGVVIAGAGTLIFKKIKH